MQRKYNRLLPTINYLDWISFNFIFRLYAYEYTYEMFVYLKNINEIIMKSMIQLL
jgi:hypothetical protein